MAELRQDAGLRAGIGSIVRVRWSGQADEEEYTIVQPHDEDFKRSLISAATPFAKAVIGRSAGETVTVQGVGQRNQVAIVSVAGPPSPNGRATGRLDMTHTSALASRQSR
jgi:transcription elongation GreA/GreB family factor